KNPQGITYDNGTYRAVMDRAMALGDWSGFKRRRAEARKRKRLRGIGLCCYLETTGGYPRERADITVQPQGRVDVVVGTLSSGQSHETTFAQCVAEWLGVPFEDVFIDESDTDIVKEGGGSHSARSMRLAGIVMGNASDLIVEKGKKIAAHMLETAEDDIGFAGGRFTVKGTDRSVGIFDVAAAARGKNLPEDFRGARGGVRRQTPAGGLARAAGGDVRRDHQAARFSLRRPCLRGRDRSADRRARACALYGGRRRRPRHQPDGGRRPDPRRRRAGHRPGAVGVLHLRRARPAAVGVVHGLRHAARRSFALVHHRYPRSAVADQ